MFRLQNYYAKIVYHARELFQKVIPVGRNNPIITMSMEISQLRKSFLSRYAAMITSHSYYKS